MRLNCWKLCGNCILAVYRPRFLLLCEIFGITACRSHQLAEADKRSKHSAFTQAFLDGLERKHADDNGRITSDRLFDLINTKLEARQQEPLRMGSGRAIVVFEYKPIFQMPSGVISPEDLGSLLEILQSQDISKYIQQSYRKYIFQDYWVDFSSGTRAILEQLNRDYLKEGKPLYLFNIVNDLIEDSNISDSVRSELQSWASKVAQAYGVNLVRSIAVSPPPVTPYLLIRLQPSKQQENYFFVKAWFFLNDQSKAEDSQFKPLTSQKFSEEQPYLFEEISELLNDFLEQTLKELNKIKDTRQPIIEFFLPREYLCAAVEQLTVLDPIDEKIPIGADHQVVVRSYERLTQRYREKAGISWLNKWSRAKQASPPFSQDLFERLNQADGYDWDILRARLIDKVGLQLACPPLQSQSSSKVSKALGNKRDLVSALLSTATPIAVWTRCPVPETTFISMVNELFKVDTLSQLPEKVYQKRIEAMKQQGEHIGQHLVLLWEDPERLPPDEESLEYKTA